MNKHIVYGNGESRPTTDLIGGEWTTTWGCNAIYRDFDVDNLVSVDYNMQQEIYESGYAIRNKCWFSDWELLPEGFDPYFSLEAPGITPIERRQQLEEAPIMYSEFDDLEADPGTQPVEGITPQAQSAWEKVKSGVSTAGDFIKNYGMPVYNFLAGSPIGAAASLLTQPFTSSESQIEY